MRSDRDTHHRFVADPKRFGARVVDLERDAGPPPGMRKAGRLTPASRRAAHQPPQWLRKRAECKLGGLLSARAAAVPVAGLDASGRASAGAGRSPASGARPRSGRSSTRTGFRPVACGTTASTTSATQAPLRLWTVVAPKGERATRQVPPTARRAYASWVSAASLCCGLRRFPCRRAAPPSRRRGAPVTEYRGNASRDWRP